MDVPIKSISRLLLDQILNPFYLFQFFSMVLWSIDGYTFYAYSILIISTSSVTVQLIETLTNLRNIKKMAYYSCKVNVKRGVDMEEIESVDLVPGDLIQIPDNTVMPCDLVLLYGSCIVNEGMLTGESIPVIKNKLPHTNDIYNPDTD